MAGSREAGAERTALILFGLAMAVSVYADLAKWKFAPTTAVAIGYGAIGLMTLWAMTTAAPAHLHSRPERTFDRGVTIVIASYVIAAALSAGVPLMNVAVGVTYICGPLIFVMQLKRFSRLVDPWRVINIFLMLMIPVQAVGMYQYFVDHSFFVLQNYSTHASIVERNLIGGGTFLRFPSIYASADRYASMSAIMTASAIYLLLAPRRKFSPLIALWLTAALALGVVGTFIGGARSRVLILVAALIPAVVINVFFERRDRGEVTYLGSIVSRYGVLIGLAIAAGAATIFMKFLSQFPIVDFLLRSFEQGDIHSRVDSALEYSSLSHQPVTLFGYGVGSLTENGVPGEFGIRALWREMGLLFGSSALIGFSLILLAMLQAGYDAFRNRRASSFFLLAYPLLTLAAGMLTGLSSTLDLSTGAMIGVFMALGLASTGLSTARAASLEATLPLRGALERRPRRPALRD